MSLRDKLFEYQSSFELNAYSRFASADIRSRWIKDGCSKISIKRPRENVLNDVQVFKNNFLVVLPEDYYIAFDDALLAVEYGFSKDFITNITFIGGSYTGRFGSSVGASLDMPGSRKRFPFPPPLVGNELVYGVRQPVLKLHQNPTNDRTETLRYFGYYQVEDRRIITVIVNQPSVIDDIVVAGVTFAFTNSSQSVDDTTILIGNRKSDTARHIALTVNKHTSDTGVTAKAKGETIIYTTILEDSNELPVEEVDYIVVTDGTNLVTTEIDSIDNLDQEADEQVFNYWSAQYFSFLATDQSSPLEKDERDRYYQKSIKLLDALENLSVATIPRR